MVQLIIILLLHGTHIIQVKLVIHYTLLIKNICIDENKKIRYHNITKRHTQLTYCVIHTSQNNIIVIFCGKSYNLYICYKIYSFCQHCFFPSSVFSWCGYTLFWKGCNPRYLSTICDMMINRHLLLLLLFYCHYYACLHSSSNVF